MTKHAFTPAERYAVFKTQGDRCYLDGEPIDMATFQVDHILPEELLNSPERLAEVLKLLGRPEDFEVNSIENWLPACGRCNNRKRNRVFDPSPLIQVNLQRAAERADAARAASQETVGNQALSRAANALARAAAAKGELPEHIKIVLFPLLVNYAADRPAQSDPLVVRVSPNYAVPLYELVSDDGTIAIAKGPYGVGGGPSPERVVSSGMTCGSCGGRFFNGTRCISCGAQNDVD